jgi:hypothetical protein
MIERFIPRKYRWLTSADLDIDPSQVSPAIKAIGHDLIGFLVRQDQAVKDWRRAVRAVTVETSEREQ